MNPIATTASWRVAHLAAVAAIVTTSLAIAGGAYAAPKDQDPVAGDWPQFHLGADKTGWNRTEQTLSSSNVAALAQRWHVAGADAGSPILVGERVFATFGDQLVAVSRGSGTQLWRQALPGWVSIPPSAIAAGGELVVVAAGGEVSAYRQSDGTRTWSAPIGGSSRGPTIAGERVYVGSSDENVYAFDLASGQSLWTAPTNGEVQSLIAVADRRVFAASMDGTLSALDASTGAVDWSAPVGEVYGGGAAAAHGNVYIAGDVPSEGSGGTLFAFGASSGRLKWTAPLGDDVHSVPAVDGHSVYIGLIVQGVRAFSAHNGRPLWTSDLGGEEVWASIAVANDVLYLATDVGTAYALDSGSGAVMWHDTPPDLLGFATQSSPAVARGALYVGFGGAGLRAYDLGG